MIAGLELRGLLLRLLVAATLFSLTLAQVLAPSYRSSHPIRPSKRDYPHIGASLLLSLAALGDTRNVLDPHDPASLVSGILIPRPPDTANNTLVRQRILDVFTRRLGALNPSSSNEHGRLGWHVEETSFDAATPEGPRKMTNLVFTKNPAAPRRLVIAAHHDSKWFPATSGKTAFVGATDSAAPCAMMLDLAIALDPLLDERERTLAGQHKDGKSYGRAEETTLQFVFFDGEEAFHTWTHTDSTYGSKQMAQNWTQTYHTPSDYLSLSPSLARAPSLSTRRYLPSSSPIRRIDTIEHLILLDLLGTPSPIVPSYFASTDWLFEELKSAEKRLDEARLLFPDGVRPTKRKSFFHDFKRFGGGGIEDDHLPFMEGGVPVLHIIPSPFPSVWHSLADDASALDYPTMYAWSQILRLAVAEYLSLEVSSSKSSQYVPRNAQGGSEESHTGTRRRSKEGTGTRSDELVSGRKRQIRADDEAERGFR